MGRETAATLKNPRSLHITQTVPRMGTRTREVYDHFMRMRGTTVSTKAIGDNHGTLITYLRDMYLLDIRHAGYGQYRLYGRWVGNTYEDYIAPLFADEKERLPC